MGDLDADTRVTGADVRCRATLSPEWEIWGPMGGDVAAVALRAAGQSCGRARPASINAHFLGGVGSGPVEVQVETNRVTRVATSSRVTVTQGDRTGLIAMVWGVDRLDGLEHHVDRRPDQLEAPSELRGFVELMQGVDRPLPHPFWANLDYRPVDWVDHEDWDDRDDNEPTTRAWTRFLPTAVFDDPWVDAARPLILLDLDGWPAAARAHGPNAEFFAPTIELTARFLQSTSDEPWLASITEAPVAAGGLIGHQAEVWTQDRRLAATGGSTMLCRPSTQRPDR